MAAWAAFQRHRSFIKNLCPLHGCTLMNAPWGVGMGVKWLVSYTGGQIPILLLSSKLLRRIKAFTVWNLFLLFHFSLQDAKIEPEEFTSRLQAELKSSPQPYLVPFLKVCFISHLQTHFSKAHSPLLLSQWKINCVTFSWMRKWKSPCRNKSPQKASHSSFTLLVDVGDCGSIRTKHVISNSGSWWTLFKLYPHVRWHLVE